MKKKENQSKADYGVWERELGNAQMVWEVVAVKPGREMNSWI